MQNFTSFLRNFKWIVFGAKLKGLYKFIYSFFFFYSDKNKRRTKTVKKTLEPKWNQTFIYSPVHRREFRERMLEITLWDQARVREEESEFLGEVSGITLKLRLFLSSWILFFMWLSVKSYILNIWRSKQFLSQNEFSYFFKAKCW